jgi:bifunctional UDP-N-acetylglucosamine pyrophosphorylase/glucosamine-1-phosphate N-acetyltransferase
MAEQEVNALILAAGKGTRMKSDKAKVLHEIQTVPMVHHVIDAVIPLHPAKIVLVVGHQHEAVRSALAGYVVSYALQEKQLGTGHAVLAARQLLPERDALVLILCGDTPLIRTETLRAMLQAHAASGAALTIMTTELDNPTGYGRVLKGPEGAVLAIVEEKDATDAQRRIREINAGIYLAETGFLFAALEQVGTDNAQGEVYLTDIVGIAAADNVSVRTFCCADPGETLGVNSPDELVMANARMQARQEQQPT